MQKEPYLTIETGPGAGTEIRITSNTLVLGRDESSDYAIPHERISRRHAQISLQDGRWLLTDLKSKNGTLINNQKVTSGILNNGDRIQLAAQAILVFHLDDPDETASETANRLMNGLWLDIDRREVFIDNRQLSPRLSKRQFDILALLVERSETKEPVVSSDEIAAKGWPVEHAHAGVILSMIDAEFYRLRQRLADPSLEHDFIITERGRGRRFQQKKIDREHG
jgi:predicted component of type VI protein secretion system